jgi:plastocyanin
MRSRHVHGDQEAAGRVDIRRGGYMQGVLTGVALAAAVLAGCGSAAPPPNASVATVDPSNTSGPTLVPGAVTAPPAGAGQLDLTAVNLDFEPKELVAVAGPVVIGFHNQDAGIPHNVQVNDPSGATLYQGEVLTGPSDTQESIGELSPGAYTFVCTIHPNMTGTLTVMP